MKMTNKMVKMSETTTTNEMSERHTERAGKAVFSRGRMQSLYT